MTEPEGLTATERALLEHAASVTSCRIDGRVVARWMHCYDAALAQSKADREWCGEMTRLNDLRGQERDAALARAEAADYGRWYDNAVQERVRRVAAESRLAILELGLDSAIGKCAEKDTRIVTLESELAAALREKQRLENAVNEAVCDYNGRVAAHTRELAEAKELLGAKHPRYREYWAQLELARSEVTALRAAIDAALARAEAAESKLRDPSLSSIIRDKQAAESRLAEATDCIKETLAGLDRLRETFVELEAEPVDADLVSADIDDASCPLRVFLSATQAPAAMCPNCQGGPEECGASKPGDCIGDPAPAATAEPLGGPVEPGQTCVPVYDPSCPRCRAMGKRCGICAHYVKQQETRESVTLIERIEAECNNKMLCAGDLADNILAIIRAAKEGA